MTNKTDTIRTATREYQVWQHDNGCFTVQFRVLNKKTGLPWQAVHRVGGTDCYQLSNHNPPVRVSPVIFGTAPAASDWGAGTPWNGWSTYFSTRELALSKVVR